MSTTTRVLSMKFDTDMGKASNIAVQHCKPDLTASAVREAMDVMIERQILNYGLIAKAGAQIVERTVTELF